VGKACFPERLLERVLVDLPVLHDQRDVLAVVAKDRDVIQRIAVDEQEVGIGAYLRPSPYPARSM